jgi:hypothetical protein
MTEAKTLLLNVLAAIPDGEKVASFFAEDGVVELPFLHAIGIQSRYEGRAKIKVFYDLVRKLYPDFGFKPQDTKVLIETPDQVFAEYTAHTDSSGNRAPHSSPVCCKACSRQRQNQVAPRVAQCRGCGSGAQPERSCRSPSACTRDLFGSTRLWLRNVYNPSNIIANTLKLALANKHKLLLTATPRRSSRPGQ